MFIFLERDTFEAKSHWNGDIARQAQREFKEDAPIRRPYRGIQVKDDTYAVLSVRHPDGSAVPLMSSSAVYPDAGGKGEVSEFSDFILQQVNDQRMEKQQIIETFGDTYVYFFGERPRMVTFSGQLMNTEDFNWRAEFWHNYENFFRGSKLVQMNARCYLAYDTIVVEGYPISAVAIDDAENPYQVSFQMTMLMTDYHEYSVIGDAKFPGGSGAASLEVLNQELDQTRKKFVSTTVEVRRRNLSGGSTTNSALAVLRAGISGWNTAASWLGDKLQIANNLLGGRAMRIPIGAASYLQMTNEAEIASASVVTSSMTSFDAKTGQRFGTITVNGQVIPGNKILIMGPSKYAPSWRSEVNGTARGYIYENYDEYPTRSQTRSLEDLVGASQYKALLASGAQKVQNMNAYQESLSLYNIFAANGSVLGAVAAVVSAVREGYGMLMTTANAIRDPAGMVTGVIGVTPQDVKKMGEGLKDGAFVPGVSMFVGGAARQTWANWAGDLVGKYATIGSVFSGWEYQSKSAADPDSKAYDSVYGNSDYTPLLKARSDKAAALVAAGQTEEAAANAASSIEKTLDEVYGNTDSANFGASSDNPATLAEVYGQDGTIQRTQPTGSERASMLNETYNGDAPPNDTDTSGITAEDADSAPIDPVV